jgi:hypothetical protein
MRTELLALLLMLAVPAGILYAGETEGTAVEADGSSTGVSIIYSAKPLPPGRISAPGICPIVPRTGSSQPNIYGLRVLDFMGPGTKAITVTYHSGDWGGFESVKEHLEIMLGVVPSDIHGHPFWAHEVSIRKMGIVGTLTGRDSRNRPFELAQGLFLCFQDPSGSYRWIILPQP